MSTLLLLISSAIVAEDKALVEFYSNSSALCQRMEPIVTELRQLGFPVRKVDVDLYPHTVVEYNVSEVPCFVTMAGEEEVERYAGITTRRELLGMLARAKVEKTPSEPASPKRSQQHPKSSVGHLKGPRSPFPDSDRESFSRSAATQDLSAAKRKVARATVRLGIVTESFGDYGSGTIVAHTGSRALVVTCGHIFRDVDDNVPVRVTIFCANREEHVSGKILSYDLENDVGLVLVDGIADVVSIPLARVDTSAQEGDAVMVAGCDYAGQPRVEATRILAVNKFIGADTIIIEATPHHGRSGGGVFNSRMELIGVCNGFTPDDGKGIYAGLNAVLEEMEGNQLVLNDLISPARNAPVSSIGYR